jgi:penicillin V acylase-like amidase (Ntn superfamily)
MKDGLHIHENPVGVLTNNPPFEQQMFMLNNYMGLSPKQPENHFADKLDLNMYSRGMGALGLPGDLSSASRFARVAFTKMNAVSDDSEEESVAQFFHILGSVDQQRGCCEVSDGKYEITIYTSCCNAIKGIYYYNTYENHQIKGSIDERLNKININGNFAEFRTQKQAFENITFSVENQQQQLKLTTRAQMPDRKGSTRLYLFASAAKDSVTTQLGWQNSNKITNAGEFQTVTKFSTVDNKLAVKMNILPTQVIISDSIWDIRASKIALNPFQVLLQIPQ